MDKDKQDEQAVELATRPCALLPPLFRNVKPSQCRSMDIHSLLPSLMSVALSDPRPSTRCSVLSLKRTEALLTDFSLWPQSSTSNELRSWTQRDHNYTITEREGWYQNRGIRDEAIRVAWMKRIDREQMYQRSNLLSGIKTFTACP